LVRKKRKQKRQTGSSHATRLSHAQGKNELLFNSVIVMKNERHKFPRIKRGAPDNVKKGKHVNRYCLVRKKKGHIFFFPPVLIGFVDTAIVLCCIVPESFCDATVTFQTPDLYDCCTRHHESEMI